MSVLRPRTRATSRPTSSNDIAEELVDIIRALKAAKESVRDNDIGDRRGVGVTSWKGEAVDATAVGAHDWGDDRSDKVLPRRKHEVHKSGGRASHRGDSHGGYWTHAGVGRRCQGGGLRDNAEYLPERSLCVIGLEGRTSARAGDVLGKIRKTFAITSCVG